MKVGERQIYCIAGVNFPVLTVLWLMAQAELAGHIESAFSIAWSEAQPHPALRHRAVA